jgi:hypothetical protein
VIIANKRNQVVKGEQNSIQRLLYLSEKRKKKAEINNENWSKVEKLDYLTWISKNFEENDEIEKICSQTLYDKPEDDLSDLVLQKKMGISTPIFNIIKGVNFLEIDLIPGTTDKTIVLNDLHRVMRGRNYVIVRMIGIKGNNIKGILEVENCAERINHMIFAKLAQITNEAQIEVGFVRMEIERIDVTNNALNPIMLVGLMWKARWVAVQGLHIDMSIENKTLVVRELIKTLDILSDKYMNEGNFDAKIKKYVASLHVRSV